MCELMPGDEIIAINGAEVANHYQDSVQMVIDQSVLSGQIEIKIRRHLDKSEFHTSCAWHPHCVVFNAHNFSFPLIVNMEEMGEMLEEEQSFLNESANRNSRLAAKRDVELHVSPQEPPRAESPVESISSDEERDIMEQLVCEEPIVRSTKTEVQATDGFFFVLMVPGNIRLSAHPL